MLDHLLTPAEVAEVLKISQRQVYNLVKDGDLVGVRIGKTESLRIKESSVTELIEKGTLNNAAS